MPQLSQLSEVLLSQLFWLAVALGFIFFVIAILILFVVK